MKKLHFSIIISCMAVGLFSCQPQPSANESIEIDDNRQKAARMEVATNETPAHDFQRIHTPVNFALAGESPTDPIDILQKRTTPRRDFVAKSGLPLLNPFQPMTNKNRDWRKADEKYRQFLIAQQGHQYLPIFRRMGSATILKDFALLADESEEGKRAIAFYTEELFESGGDDLNAPLVYYCLRALDGAWVSSKIKGYAQRAIATNAQSADLVHFRNAPVLIKQDMATVPIDTILIKMKEQDIANLTQIVAEHDEYIEKLRIINFPRD